MIVIAGFLVYSNSLAGPFVFDDNGSIVQNGAVRQLPNIAAAAFQRDTPIAGRPVVALTFALNYAVSGLAVQAYHLTNIAVHVLCALLLFGLARRTLRLPAFGDTYRTSADDLALATALLWALHPLNTEVVDYVTQRTESMMAFFFLAMLYAGVRSATCRRKAMWATVAVLSCGLGMASKESMVVAPVVLVLYDRIFLFDSLAEALKARWRLYAGLASTCLVLVYLMLPGPRASTVGMSKTVAPWTYLLNQAQMVARYLRLAIWPSDLVINYGPVVPLHLSQVLPTAALILVLLTATVVALFRWPPIGFLGAWVFLTLAPTSTVIPIATEVGAERRMYLPLMAIAALAVVGACSVEYFRHRVSRPAAMSTLALLLLALGAATLARNREYATSLSLSESVLRRWPTDVAHGMVGSDLASLHRDEEALRELRLAARTDPRSRYNLGVELFNTRQFDEAIRELQIFTGANPWLAEVPSANMMIGQAFSAQRKWPQALAQFRMVLTMAPGDREAPRLLAGSLMGQGNDFAANGQFDKAINSFRQAVDLDPDSVTARHNLAQALLDRGDLTAALTTAQEAVRRQPADAALHDLLGRVLATQGKLDEAIAEFEQALRLDPNAQTAQEDLRRTREFAATSPGARRR